MVSFMIRHFKLSNLHTHALLPRHIAWLYCSNDNTDQWWSIQTNDLRVAGADRERGRGPGGTKGGVQCGAAGAACAIVADGADGAATPTITY